MSVKSSYHFANFWLATLGAIAFWLFIAGIVLMLGLGEGIHWIPLIVGIAFFGIGLGVLWRWLQAVPRISVDEEGVKLR